MHDTIIVGVIFTAFNFALWMAFRRPVEALSARTVRRVLLCEKAVNYVEQFHGNAKPDEKFRHALAMTKMYDGSHSYTDAEIRIEIESIIGERKRNAPK
jgi:hypothetical protein